MPPMDRTRSHSLPLCATVCSLVALAQLASAYLQHTQHAAAGATVPCNSCSSILAAACASWVLLACMAALLWHARHAHGNSAGALGAAAAAAAAAAKAAAQQQAKEGQQEQQQQRDEQQAKGGPAHAQAAARAALEAPQCSCVLVCDPAAGTTTTSSTSSTSSTPPPLARCAAAPAATCQSGGCGGGPRAPAAAAAAPPRPAAAQQSSGAGPPRLQLSGPLRAAAAAAAPQWPLQQPQGGPGPGSDACCPCVDVMDVWVLAGQSNCVGTNQADGQEMPALAAPWPGRILSYCNTRCCWQDARPNVHLGVYGYADADSVGPDMAFARMLIQAGAASTQVGLVPTACGGTNLYEQWKPGNMLWSNMVADTTRAMQLLGGRGRLRGLVWIQGESDAVSQDTAAAYAANFAAWLAATRAALTALHPRLPVALVVMSAARGRRGAFPFIEAVAAAQRGLRLPGTVWKCEMAGFELYPDPASGQLVHLTKAGACAMGVSLAFQVASSSAGT